MLQRLNSFFVWRVCGGSRSSNSLFGTETRLPLQSMQRVNGASQRANPKRVATSRSWSCGCERDGVAGLHLAAFEQSDIARKQDAVLVVTEPREQLIVGNAVVPGVETKHP
jgi:hypothetical protein